MKLKLLVFAAVATAVVVGSAHAQWIPTGSGAYDFNSSGNWTGGTINGAFSSNLTASPQTIDVSADYNLATYGLSFTDPNPTTRTQLLLGSGAPTFTTSAVTAGGVFTTTDTTGLSGKIVKITGAQNGLFVANEYIVNVISGTTFSLSQNAANPTLNTITTNGVNGGATFYVERSLTLGGGVSVNTANATSAITFGNSTAASTLNLQMGGADRTIDVAAGESLSIINAITGANALTKSGNGTLLLGQGGSGNVTVSNFNALHITGGTVIVTGNAGSGSAKGTPLSGSAGTGTITMDSGTTLTLSSAASPYNPIFMNATGGNVTLKGGHSAELAVEGGIFGNGTLNIVGAPNNAAQIDGVQLGGSAIANTYVGNIIVYNQGTVNGTVSAGLAQLRLGAMPFGN